MQWPHTFANGLQAVHIVDEVLFIHHTGMSHAMSAQMIITARVETRTLHKGRYMYVVCLWIFSSWNILIAQNATIDT